MSMASVGAYSGRPPIQASADVAAEYWLDVDDWRPIQRFEGPPVGGTLKTSRRAVASEPRNTTMSALGH